VGVEALTKINGWIRFSVDDSAENPTGATSVVVFGPATEIDDTVTQNYPTADIAYELCGNSGPAQQYTENYLYSQLDAAYQSYMAGGAGAYGVSLSDTNPEQAQNGNLTLNVTASTPNTGNAWTVTYGDAGSSYDFGMGYLDGNDYYYFDTNGTSPTTYSQDDLVFPGQFGHTWAFAFQFWDPTSNERTYQVFCETLSAP
jgi:hypothetical protein